MPRHKGQDHVYIAAINAAAVAAVADGCDVSAVAVRLNISYGHAQNILTRTGCQKVWLTADEYRERQNKIIEQRSKPSA